MDERWEVLVVGAGPAGSGAARAAAASGAKTLMIDRKREIGTPVQCGEVIGQSLLELSGIEIAPSAKCGDQDFTRFVVNRSLSIDNHEDYWASVTVERKLLDKHLAELAALEGASVQADTQLLSIEMEEGRVTRAHLRRRGRKMSVRPEVVVAADGVHSTMSRLMGVEIYPPDEVAKGVEFEMISRRDMPRCMQIFLEPEIGLGYGWIIPKGGRRANVGLGVVGEVQGRKELLARWISENPVVNSYFHGGSILEVRRGEAPIPGFRGGPHSGNVLFAGDAAGQTLAFVGEGIAPSYFCGRIAGEVAAASLGDHSQLSSYDDMVIKAMGEELGEGSRIKDLIINSWMRQDISPRDRILLCALLMSGCLSSDEVTRLTARDLSALEPERIGQIVSSPLIRIGEV